MWSKKYDKCVICGTTNRKYYAKGMCKSCHNKDYREKNKIRRKKYIADYYCKNKDKIKKRAKAYYQENIRAEREGSRRYYYNNIEKSNLRSKKWKHKNIEKARKYVRNWQYNNREKTREIAKNYYYKNIEKRKIYNKKYQKINKKKIQKNRLNKYHNNYRYKLRQNITNLINHRLHSRFSSKNWRPISSFLPYTIDELIRHLEKQFKKGMTWSNHGKWHIDHIRPDCKFNYKSVDDEKFKKCWALENLQPLWAEDNLKKGGKLIN